MSHNTTFDTLKAILDGIPTEREWPRYVAGVFVLLAAVPPDLRELVRQALLAADSGPLWDLLGEIAAGTRKPTRLTAAETVALLGGPAPVQPPPPASDPPHAEEEPSPAADADPSPQPAEPEPDAEQPEESPAAEEGAGEGETIELTPESARVHVSPPASPDGRRRAKGRLDSPPRKSPPFSTAPPRGNRCPHHR
jgi:hypothetical protein